MTVADSNSRLPRYNNRSGKSCAYLREVTRGRPGCQSTQRFKYWMRRIGDLDTWGGLMWGKKSQNPHPENRRVRHPAEKNPRGAGRARPLQDKAFYCWGLGAGAAGLGAGFLGVAGLAGVVAAAPIRVADLMVSSLGQWVAMNFSPPLEMFSWSMPAFSPYWS